MAVAVGRRSPLGYHAKARVRSTAPMTLVALVPRALEYVAAMRAAVSGVNVVTTDGEGGRLGLTVTALASVSDEPEMLLVCIARRSPVLEAVRENGVFGVSMLGAHQAPVAAAFAGRGPSAFAFGAGRWDAGPTGAPLLEGAAARFDCVVASTVEAGSHAIFIGDVLAAETGAAPPLAFADGDYAWISPTPVSSAATPATRVAEIGRRGRRSNP
jgi:flavin reductase (DIM6/NTAB) family NADH-FMN oxidoreductase RutF